MRFRFLLALSFLGVAFIAGCQQAAVGIDEIAEPTALPPIPTATSVAVVPTLRPAVITIAPAATATTAAASMPSFSLGAVETATAAPTLLAPTVAPEITASSSLPTPFPTPFIPTTTAIPPLPTLAPGQTPYPGAEPSTPLPPPTFTPPAALVTSPNDHYWLQRPVPEGGVVWTDKTYPYGSTRGGTLQPHHGVEFNVPAGTPIFAAAAGTVVVAGDDLTTAYGLHTNFYGNLVVIQHDTLYNGLPLYTLYGHLSEVQVSVGQTVGSAEQIALSGATGIADGPHLHFEVRIGQNSYTSTRNPLLWLYPFPGRGVVAGRVTFPGGQPAYEAPISLRRLDASSPYSATTSYAQETLNPDDGWQENFALDDVAAGYYEVSVRNGDKTIKTEFWVFPYQTSFVEIELP